MIYVLNSTLLMGLFFNLEAEFLSLDGKTGIFNSLINDND